MIGFTIFCLLVLVPVSYAQFQGATPGDIYSLLVAQRKTYNRAHVYELQSSEVYLRETHNTRLRYDDDSSYTILTNDGNITFIVKYIFIVVRNIVGIVTEQNNVNVLLKFVNEQHARDMCLERYNFDNYSSNDFEVETVLAIDSMMNERVRVIEILNSGAIDVSRLESSSPSSVRGVYFRFTIHPTGNGPKPPIAMFVTDLIRVQRGAQSNLLVMEHEVGNGAFYFGLVFSSSDKADRFLETLAEMKVMEEIEDSEKIQAITEKLFEHYS